MNPGRECVFCTSKWKIEATQKNELSRKKCFFFVPTREQKHLFHSVALMLFFVYISTRQVKMHCSRDTVFDRRLELWWLTKESKKKRIRRITDKSQQIWLKRSGKMWCDSFSSDLLKKNIPTFQKLIPMVACGSRISWLFFFVLPLKQSDDEWRAKSSKQNAQHSKRKKKCMLLVLLFACSLYYFNLFLVPFIFFFFSLSTLWKVLVSVLFAAIAASFVDWCRFMFYLFAINNEAKEIEMARARQQEKRGKLKNWVVLHGKQIERSKKKTRTIFRLSKWVSEWERKKKQGKHSESENSMFVHCGERRKKNGFCKWNLYGIWRNECI